MHWLVWGKSWVSVPTSTVESLKVTFFYADYLVFLTYELVVDGFDDDAIKRGGGVGAIYYEICSYYEQDSFRIVSFASSIFAFRNGMFLNWL